MVNWELHVNVNIDVDELVNQLTRELSEDDIMEFILQIEENVMDWRFTKKLRDKLSEMLDAAGE